MVVAKSGTFILFGATGFVGRAIQAALVARAIPYIGFGSNTLVRKETEQAAVTRPCTLSDRTELLKHMSSPKAIIFAAGPALVTSDHEALRRAHLDSLRAALETLPQERLHDLHDLPFIYTSSGLVYGRRSSIRALKETDPVMPNSIYGEIKLRCEEFLTDWRARTGVRAVAARLFNLSGIGQKNGIVVDVVRQAVEIRAKVRTGFKLHSNRPILDIVDVREAADALVRLADIAAPPAVVNVCSGRPLTTEDIVSAAKTFLGCEASISYDEAERPSEALVGAPDLIAQTTGWQARKTIDQLVAEMTLNLERRTA